jgi:hypothetical protein
MRDHFRWCAVAAFAVAFALALSGDVARSRALADDLEKTLPEDTSVQHK